MRYIRSCPNCSMELRFPLDMGILIITCPTCNTSFRMDPNDPKTYLSGAFDLTPVQKKFPFNLQIFESLKNYAYSPKDIKFLIPLLLAFLLLLNFFKIMNSVEGEQKLILEKEQEEFFQELEPDGIEQEGNEESSTPYTEI